MTGYFEDPYIESDYNEIFNKLYEVEGVRKIKELSRQLRTFFNYQSEVIRYRFRSSTNLIENTNTKFFIQKQKLESLSNEFIIILKNLKKPTQTIEEGIHSLFFDNDKTTIKNLSEITEKISILLHYFSEENIHYHPIFLKFITVLAQEIYSVKKCLNAEFSEFYEELEMNYYDLEGEMEILLQKVPNKKTKKAIKQLEERLSL